MKIPSVKLISTIEYPIETIYCLWQASRSKGPVQMPFEIFEQRMSDEDFNRKVMDTFDHVISSAIPVSENLDFIFLIEDMPISLREQIVRHRIGHKFGDNFGVDTIPGSVDSSWWSQSMRILDMGSFADAGDFYVPDTIGDQVLVNPQAKGKDMSLAEAMEQIGTARGVYTELMKAIGQVYRILVDNGVPPEDARQVIPLAATSRISWKMNYMAAKHVLHRRGCWIAQLGMWRPIVVGMVDQLSRIHPCFRKLINPPCFSRDEGFEGCPFPADNLKRVQGVEDPEPPCPLFLHHHRQLVLESLGPKDRKYNPEIGRSWDASEPRDRQRFVQLQNEYRSLWQRNTWTGEKL